MTWTSGVPTACLAGCGSSDLELVSEQVSMGVIIGSLKCRSCGSVSGYSRKVETVKVRKASDGDEETGEDEAKVSIASADEMPF